MRRIIMALSALLACLASVFLIGAWGLARADGQDNRVWLLVSFDDKDRATLMNGSINKETFQRLTSGEAKGFVELDQVFWKKGGQFHYAEMEGKDTGLTDKMIISVDRIISLRPLAPDYVKQALSKRARDRASRLSEPGQ